MTTYRIGTLGAQKILNGIEPQSLVRTNEKRIIKKEKYNNLKVDL